MSALVFAIAASIKVYPVLFALYWLLRRNFRMLAWIVFWGAAINLLPLLLGAWNETWVFLELLPKLGGTSASVENAGIDRLFMGLSLASWFYHGLEPFDPENFSRVAAFSWRILGLGACVGAAVWMKRRGALENVRGRFLLFGTSIVVALQWVPAAWVNYQILYIPALFGVAMVLPHCRAGFARGTLLTLAALSVIPLLVPLNLVLLGRYADPRMSKELAIVEGVSLEFEPELSDRINRRERQLEALQNRDQLRGSGAFERHRELVSAGVDVGSTDRQHALRTTAALSLAREIDRTQHSDRSRLALKIAEWQARLVRFTAHQLIMISVSRSVLGVLVLLMSLLACFSLRRFPLSKPRA